MTQRLTTLLLAFALAAAATAPIHAAPTPKALYALAAERERAARAELEQSPSATTREAALRAVRAAVARFEAIVRRFPTSGYCDDALWHGADLAAAAWRRYGDQQDRITAERLLKALRREYPLSRLGALVPELLARLEPAAKTRVAPVPTRRSAPAQSLVPAAPAAPALPVTSLAPPVPAAPVAVDQEVPDDYVAGSRPVSRAPAAPAPPAVVLLHGVRRDLLPNGVRITLDLDREVSYRDEQAGAPSRVALDLRSTRPENPQAPPLIFPDGLVRQVRISRVAAGSTRVQFETAAPARYSIFALYNPYRLVIDFEQAPAAASRGAEPRLAPPFRSPADKPAPAAPLSSPAAAPQVATAPAPRRALEATGPGPSVAPTGAATGELSSGNIAGSSAPAATIPTTAPAAPSSNLRGGFSLSRQLGLGVARIVIDAGHGGHDPGAQGRGLSEADLVLDIALRVEKLLQKQRGVEVLLTRRTDAFVPLRERTAIANRAGADLFLSIHANASPNARTRGIETYFLNFALNPEAEAIAARENATSGETMRHLPDIVRAIALNNKIDESRDFAAFVQNALVARVKAGRNLGVKQAPFVVLIGATMPSILAEISFITNRDDAQLLKTAAHRQKIAEALFGGIMRYQRSLKAAATVATQ